jgi:hypothetical protein
MAVFTPTITGLTSLTTENINIDNNSITALNSSIEQVSYTSVTTNLFTYSQTFNTGDWQALNATVAVNNTTAPDGTTTADKITQNSGSTNVDLSNLRDVGLTSNSGTDYTISIHAKISANRNFLVINEHISSDAFRKTWFNLSNGTVGTNYSSHTATITDEGNGWYRCSITVTSTVTNTDSIIMFGPAETDGAYIITDNQGSMFFWGAQLEESATLTGYLTTTSASLSGLTGVTRGVSGTTAATASSGGTITLGSASTTLSVNITATQDYIPLASLTGVAASGTASIGTSNMDLNLSASGTGSVTINQIKTNSVTGEVIPGKLEGTNFTNSLLIGHSTTGTLSSAGQNVGVGLESLEDITSGDYNTAAGYQAGKSNTTATGNTFIGALSGVNTTSTGASVGVGYRTLWGNYGIGNSAIGYYASRFNGNGTGNVSIGRESLEGVSGTSHSYNTALGAYSNTAITTGGYNVTLGYESGDNITTGSGNIIIGSVDAGSATGDRQLKIAGYDGTTTTTWLSGDSSGNLTFPAQTTTGNLVAGSILVDNLILNSNSISAVNSSVEQINYSTLSSNEITYSQDGTQLNGSANVTMANGAGTAPDGTNTAVSMTPTGSGTQSYVSHFAQLNPVVAGVSLPLTYSVYVKGTGFIQLYTNTFHIGGGAVNVDLSDGSITIPASIGGDGYAKSFDVGNGWYRVEISRSATPSLTYYQGAYYIASVDSASASRIAVSSNTDVKYWWGAQFEKTWQNGSTVSSSTGVTNAGPYVPTDGTRIALALAGVNRTASVADSVIRGASGTTASSANADVVVNIGSTTTALLTSITTTSKVIPIDEVSGLPTSGTAVIGTSNVDLNLSASGTGNVKLANDEKLVFGDAGEHIVGDGTDLTIASSGKLKIDAAGDIELDGGSGVIDFIASGTVYGNVAISSNNLIIKSRQSNGDMEFRGNDGGSEITALTLDMSEAGAATFNGTVSMSGGQAIPGKLEGDNFTQSLLIGHSNHGTLNNAIRNLGIGAGGLTLSSLTSGDHNIGIGFTALRNVTSGSSNIGIGSEALTGTGGGINNVAVGVNSLKTGGTKVENTALGNQSGLLVTTGNVNLFLGLQSGANITTGSGNVIIGSVNAPSATADRQLVIAGHDGTNTTTWISGDSAGLLTITGGEVIPGKLEGTNFTDSLLIGHSTTGTLSSADRNTGVGIEALDAVTAGDTNTAVGYQSGTLITYGQQNTSLGGVSLAANVSGGYNTSAGAYSLQKTTANNNTAFGYQAGKEVVGGASNIFLGYQAGNNITSGDGNVVIGNGDVASATGDKQLKISDGVDGSVAWITGDSSGNITVPAGIHIGGTGDANKLDDYEEGTFTPTIALGITSVGYSSRWGQYTKIGNTVSFSFNIQTNAGTLNSSRLKFGGLPFDVSGSVRGFAVFNFVDGDFINSKTNNLPTLVFEPNPTIEAYFTDGTQFLGNNLTNASGNNIYIGGVYESV